MKRGRKAASVADKARFVLIKDIGCIACRAYGLGFRPCDVHHLTVGGKHGQPRRGHAYSIGLCPPHHTGTPDNYGPAPGPSYAKAPRAFRATFGSDDELLAKQNALIAARLELVTIKPVRV